MASPLDKDLEIHHSTRPTSKAGSSDLDDSYDVYRKAQGVEIDPSDAKRVLRKIDKRIVPVLLLIYLLQYLDKNGINYASVYGLQKGTNLHGDDYSWLGMTRPPRIIGTKLILCQDPFSTLGICSLSIRRATLCSAYQLQSSLGVQPLVCVSTNRSTNDPC
jgi:hypothetical protein